MDKATFFCSRANRTFVDRPCENQRGTLLQRGTAYVCGQGCVALSHQTHPWFLRDTGLRHGIGRGTERGRRLGPNGRPLPRGLAVCSRADAFGWLDGICSRADATGVWEGCLVARRRHGRMGRPFDRELRRRGGGGGTLLFAREQMPCTGRFTVPSWALVTARCVCLLAGCVSPGASDPYRCDLPLEWYSRAKSLSLVIKVGMHTERTA